MNYMEKVAEMLGVEIGEEFKVDLDGVVYRKNFYFTEYSLFVVGDDKPEIGVLNNLLNGNYKIIKLPKSILTDEEKEYLSYVIKPFRNRIKCFYKWACEDCNYEQIMAPCIDYSHLDFPSFEKNTMYKGMEPNKKYTLDDLGL